MYNTLSNFVLINKFYLKFIAILIKEFNSSVYIIIIVSLLYLEDTL